MATDFDKVINRKRNTSLKYDFATVRGKKADILPLWVADMDFQAPKAVRERLFEIVEHGIFGYSDTLEDYFRAVKSWYKRRFAGKSRVTGSSRHQELYLHLQWQ